MSKIIAITGATGSGKSTVATALAKKFDKYALIEIDRVKHMIPSGFSKEIDNNGKTIWHYSEWKLVGETIGIMGKNFIEHGFDVVIEGYQSIEGWSELQKHVDFDYKFLLRPSVETTKNRDEGRDEEYVMGAEAIQEHTDQLSTEYFQDFIIIDSTALSLDETLAEIESTLSLN